MNSKIIIFCFGDAPFLLFKIRSGLLLNKPSFFAEYSLNFKANTSFLRRSLGCLIVG